MKLTSALAAASLLALPVVAIDVDQTDWLDLGGELTGVAGGPVLAGWGDPLPGSQLKLELRDAAPLAPAFLVLGATQLDLPLLGGVLLPDPGIVLGPTATDAAGMIEHDVLWPGTAPTGIDLFFQYWILDAAGPQGFAASNGLLATPGAPATGSFPAAWQDGTDCASEVPIQVHAYNQDTYILRQSLCTSFEGPFLHLLLGQEKALLIDSGDGAVGLGGTIGGIINTWKASQGITNYELVVAHTHSHGDHTGGDSVFAGQPNATVVGLSKASVQAHFGFTNWPLDIAEYDLGGRIVDVLPIPGHQDAHLAFYDRSNANLITGDSLYPGRLYVFNATLDGNWAIFAASMQRLVDFIALRDVRWVLGTHVEMTAVAGVDYPFGSAVHPNEHVLELERKHLVELNQAMQSLGPTPVIDIHDDFIIFPIQ